MKSAVTRIRKHSAVIFAAAGACIATVLPVAGVGAQEIDGPGSGADRSASGESAVIKKAAHLASGARGQEIGSPVLLRGRVSEGGVSALGIHFNPRGTRAWRPVKRVRTNRNGAFLTQVPARRHGQLVALPPNGEPSEPITVRVRSEAAVKVNSRNVEIGDRAKVIGRALPGKRRAYRIVVKGADSRVIEGVTSPDGKFRAGWDVTDVGTHRIKIYVGANRTALGSSAPSRKITAFRPVHASWYGPGFYGGTTACGQTLTSSTLGVAHKTLPCGTKLSLRYGGRTVQAKVIDRGPYIPGREIDLTYATKQKLGFGDVGEVWIDR